MRHASNYGSYTEDADGQSRNDSLRACRVVVGLNSYMCTRGIISLYFSGGVVQNTIFLGKRAIGRVALHMANCIRMDFRLGSIGRVC